MRQLLTLAPRPSAVFAESDEMAYGAIRAIRRAGLTVPDDVAVIGFDDHATAQLIDLSTVRQPLAEQGARLARTLLTAVHGAVEPTDLVLDTELVVPGSTVAAASVYAGATRSSRPSRRSATTRRAPADVIRPGATPGWLC
jgi:LacI family repressor for deo operon, udp, cdd, tsx, nupC, and nupG